MKFELVIVWETGERDVYEYGDRESAEKGAAGMRMALGNQIRWSGVRPMFGKHRETVAEFMA